MKLPDHPKIKAVSRHGAQIHMMTAIINTAGMHRLFVITNNKYRFTDFVNGIVRGVSEVNPLIRLVADRATFSNGTEIRLVSPDTASIRMRGMAVRCAFAMIDVNEIPDLIPILPVITAGVNNYFLYEI